MIQGKNGIVVVGAIFVDIKGFPQNTYIPDGRNAGYIEYIHGGVARNVVEDIANLGLNSTFVGIVDNTALGKDVKQHLQNRNVNTDYMKSIENGMGTWLAVFDHNGELAGSVSQRPDLMPIYSILEEYGDTIIENCDSVVAEIDMDEEIVDKIVDLCRKYNKKLFGVVSNMNIAIERKDLLKQFDCLICNQLESSILFSRDYGEISVEELSYTLLDELQKAEFNSLIVTLGEAGSLYVKNNGECGFCQARKIEVKDTTG
ncbi:carbohydrate kinase family protein, partial [uncultured Holdemanella sp.]|uniref:carbohydrate kinase family protein n=1 Tax=uncultured Holdemanella sp. TaxID=1763549 RepID=UPI0025E631E7